MPLSIAFEAQTLLSADLQNKVHKTDDQVKTKLAPAERERERERKREREKARLESLRFKGEGNAATKATMSSLA